MLPLDGGVGEGRRGLLGTPLTPPRERKANGRREMGEFVYGDILFQKGEVFLKLENQFYYLKPG